eukprot:m.3678 g.3678  ORF g.3678 m.3678 type:complete len:632 (-) comp2804_c0_seq1:122-2017(-)
MNCTNGPIVNRRTLLYHPNPSEPFVPLSLTARQIPHTNMVNIPQEELAAPLAQKVVVEAPAPVVAPVVPSISFDDMEEEEQEPINIDAIVAAPTITVEAPTKERRTSRLYGLLTPTEGSRGFTRLTRRITTDYGPGDDESKEADEFANMLERSRNTEPVALIQRSKSDAGGRGKARAKTGLERLQTEPANNKARFQIASRMGANKRARSRLTRRQTTEQDDANGPQGPMPWDEDSEVASAAPSNHLQVGGRLGAKRATSRLTRRLTTEENQDNTEAGPMPWDEEKIESTKAPKAIRESVDFGVVLNTAPAPKAIRESVDFGIIVSEVPESAPAPKALRESVDFSVVDKSVGSARLTQRSSSQIAHASENEDDLDEAKHNRDSQKSRRNGINGGRSRFQRLRKSFSKKSSAGAQSDQETPFPSESNQSVRRGGFMGGRTRLTRHATSDPLDYGEHTEGEESSTGMSRSERRAAIDGGRSRLQRQNNSLGVNEDEYDADVEGNDLDSKENNENLGPTRKTKSSGKQRLGQHTAPIYNKRSPIDNKQKSYQCPLSPVAERNSLILSPLDENGGALSPLSCRASLVLSPGSPTPRASFALPPAEPLRNSIDSFGRNSSLASLDHLLSEFQTTIAL